MPLLPIQYSASYDARSEPLKAAMALMWHHNRITSKSNPVLVVLTIAACYQNETAEDTFVLALFAHAKLPEQR